MIAAILIIWLIFVLGSAALLCQSTMSCSKEEGSFKAIVGVILLFASIFALPIGLRYLEGPPKGPEHAKLWAQKYNAESIECTKNIGYLYDCTAIRNNQIIALECWEDGCKVVATH